MIELSLFLRKVSFEILDRNSMLSVFSYGILNPFGIFSVKLGLARMNVEGLKLLRLCRMLH